jgi:hypothetical protein
MKALVLLGLAILAGSVFGWILHVSIDQEPAPPPVVAVQPYSGPSISRVMRTLALRDLSLFTDRRELEYIAKRGDQSAGVDKGTEKIEREMSRLVSHERKTSSSYLGDQLLLMQLMHARITTFESAWAVHAGADSATLANSQQLAAVCSALARNSAQTGRFVGWHDEQNHACLDVPNDADLHTVLTATLAYTDNRLAIAEAQHSILLSDKSAKTAK